MQPSARSSGSTAVARGRAALSLPRRSAAAAALRVALPLQPSCRALPSPLRHASLLQSPPRSLQRAMRMHRRRFDGVLRPAAVLLLANAS